MAIRTDQFTNSLTVVDTVNANAPLNLIPQGTAAVNIPGTGQNLITYSEQFQQTNWTKNLCTIIVNTDIAPNGTLTAETLVTTTPGDVFLEHGFNSTAPICYSFFAKQGGASPSPDVVLRMITFATAIGDVVINFNFSTKTFSGATGFTTSFGYVDVGNGWFRIYATLAAAPGQTGGAIRLRAGSLVAGNTVLLWGAQVEASGYLGPYVQTTTTAIYGTPSLSFSGISGLGLQSDGSLYASAAGLGNIRLYTNNVAQEQARVSHTASAVNYVQVTGAATGNAVNLSAQGSDTNIQFNINSKNAFGIQFGTGGGTQFLVSNTAAAANYLRATGGATGFGPVLSAQGSDTNIDLTLTPKGTGNVRFGTHTASADTAVSGYIEIKDSGGTIRKLAVIT